MEYSISIKKLWSDEHLIELDFKAATPFQSSSINVYVDDEMIIDLQRKLISFSINKEEEVEWIVGDKNKDNSDYLYLRLFYYNRKGHVAFEIEIINCSEEPYGYRSHFYIGTELASVDEFAKEILKLLETDQIVIEGIKYRHPEHG